MLADLLKISDLLRILQIKRTTLHRWRVAGNFPPPICLSGPSKKLQRWRREDVEAWLAEKNKLNGVSKNDYKNEN